MSLKDNWKNTGVGLGHAFRDLGKSIVKTVATGAEKADKWANSEDHPEDAKPEPIIVGEEKEEPIIVEEK